MADSTTLLEPAFIDRLARLAWRLSQGRDGERGRATRRTGGTHDFRGHRAYSPGDEPRSIDWAALGRTDQLVVRTFARETEASVRVVIDRTRSMQVGEKPRRVLEVAAALAYVALRSGHRVTFATAADGASNFFGPWSGAAHIPVAFEALERLPGFVGRDFCGGVGSMLAGARGPGAIVLITDGFDEAGLEAMLERIGRTTRDASMFHLLDREDIAPTEEGTLDLTDAESGATLRLDVDAATRAAFTERAEAWRAAIVGACRKRRIAYQRVGPTETLESAVIEWHEGTARVRV